MKTCTDYFSSNIFNVECVGPKGAEGSESERSWQLMRRARILVPFLTKVRIDGEKYYM